MFDNGETVGLAEWIIDEICLVSFLFFYSIDPETLHNSGTTDYSSPPANFKFTAKTNSPGTAAAAAAAAPLFGFTHPAAAAASSVTAAAAAAGLNHHSK